MNMNRSSASFANFFMLFLLSYNILFAFTLGYLYRNVFYGSFIGELLFSPWFLSINQIFGLLVPLLIFKGLSKDTVKMPARPLGLINFVLILALSLLLQPAMMFLSGLASLAMPNPVAGIMSDLMTMPLPIALVLIALTPAICEELVFRGYIQTKYENQPIAVSAVINGIFFGIIHLNLHQFAYAFVMGVIFVFFVHITRSVYSAVLSHFIINASQFSLGRFAATQIGPEGIEPSRADLLGAIQGIGLLFMATLPLVVFLFSLLIKHNKGEAVNSPEEKLPFDHYFFAVLLLFGILVMLLS